MKTAEQGKNILIGILVIAACSLMIWTLIFLNPTVGDAGKVIKVRFVNIDKVSIGTRVSYAGKPVGKVVDIEPIDIPQTSNRPGPVYAYEVTLAIDSKVTVYKSDQFAIHTSGLLGERSVVITPKRPRMGQALEELTKDDVMYASSSGSVEETFSGLSSLAKKVEQVLAQLSDFLEVNGEDFGQSLTAVKNAFVKFDGLLQKADDVDLVDSVNHGFEEFASAMKKIDVSLFFERINDIAKNIKDITEAINQPENLHTIIKNASQISTSFASVSENIKDSWPKFNDAIIDMAVSASTARHIADRLSDSNSTVGKLLFDDGLYLQMRLIFSKIETLMDDVNHYGILFHLDRSWQRQRTRRMNILAELSTANQFRDYFEQEITQINTSLSRVSQLLDRTENGMSSKELIDNREFTKVFSELLRRVETLSETLKMYNEQVSHTNNAA